MDFDGFLEGLVEVVEHGCATREMHGHWVLPRRHLVHAPFREIDTLLPNRQRQHRTLHIQKDVLHIQQNVLPYAL